MALTLLQKVFISAQELYKENVNTFTTQMLYDKFLQLDFYTPDKDWPRAMSRRMFDLMSCWYATVYKREGKFVTYKLTHSWRHAKANKIHLSYVPVFKDNKEHDMPKRLKTWKSDKMRSVQAESQIKSENKVLNEVVSWKDIKLDRKNETTSLSYYNGHEIIITDILRPMTPKPKHTLRQHIKSLFWL